MGKKIEMYHLITYDEMEGSITIDQLHKEGVIKAIRNSAEDEQQTPAIADPGDIITGYDMVEDMEGMNQEDGQGRNIAMLVIKGGKIITPNIGKVETTEYKVEMK